ncbi:putative transcriptional regulator [Pseudomonas sp. GM50]|uniref:helix-turn-helix domain-containing protein n=1 Tax=Pseudomonas sp. GM50 TaxID=1144332 RepID=UPI0002708050|nr:helix-turn-helix transcriptional regulator [Pseudomonas sp. GM50]EJM71122.1 putative transcriptional regulator [Pseudomonas sp. GM50]
MGIGDRLKEERERLGFNQTEFAAKAGVSKNSQYNYEKGERSPDATCLAAIAENGVDILYVVTGEHKPVSADWISTDAASFLVFFQSISEPDRDVLFRMAAAFAKAASIDAKKDND